MGYDEMGHELWKPYLRAMMESDMKAVSIGTKNKAEVLETCLQQMKACFVDAKLNKAKLFEAMEVFFERSNRSAANDQHTFGDVVRRCDHCRESDMVLKRKPDGNFMVGCMGYPQCRNVVWLPGSISEATVTTSVCTTCNPGPILMIQFKFRRVEIPMNFNVEHLGCIGGCDDILKQLIETCGTGSRDILGVSGRGRGSNLSSRNVQPRIPRQTACTNCMQTGHTSNSCPSQSSGSHNARSQGVIQQGEPSIPCGTCGNPCMLRTANTEQNRGKKFYSCQGCNFFIWEDVYNERSAPSSNYGERASVQSRRGVRGRGSRGGRRGTNASGSRFVSAVGEPISDRRCFVCQDPSHFANACPSRGM